MTSLRILFHLIGALQFGYGCYYDFVHVHVPSTSKTTSFGGKFKFLTNLNAMIQTIYFLVALYNDIFGNNESTASEKPLIRHIKDRLFCSLAFPISLFVGLTFWAIYAVDRELILPKGLDPYFPTWLNHVMHTNIVIFILIEMVTSFRMYPPRKQGITILTLFMVCYMVWIHVVYFVSGAWVYPILRVMSWPFRIMFYLFSLGLVLGLYRLGEHLNAAVWSREVEDTIRSGRKKAK